MENLDLIQAQRDLEVEMRDMTIARYRKSHEKAADRGEFVDTQAGKGIANHLEGATLEAINAFVAEANSGKAGVRHKAVQMVADLDAETVAFLVTKTIVNQVPMLNAGSRDPITVNRLAFAIAGVCHDEIALRYFETNNRKLLKRMMEDFNHRDLPRRRRKELIQRSMSKLRLEWEQEGWGDQNRLHFGIKMIDLFRTATGCVEIGDTGKGTKKQKKVIMPTEALLKALEDRMNHYESVFTLYLPMVVQPKPWEAHNLYGGGYLTGNITPYCLVKDSNKPYLEELENSDLTDVLCAVNNLQQTSWNINKRMLEVTEWAYAHHGERCGFPSADPKDIPVKPANADTDEEVSKEYRKACYMVHDENRRAVSKRIMALQAFKIAHKLSAYPAHYYPHYMDSRGRMYPKPVILNPQGADFVKSLLEFGEGKPVVDGSDAHAWIMIAAANAYGEDKLSLNGRIEWAQNNGDLILGVAQDPYADQRWMDADEPFAFLRFCMDLRGIAEATFDGTTFVSHVPVPVDATCSGIQHFSAMLRDKKGAEATNVRNFDERKDIYQQVADLTITKLQNDLLNSDADIRAKAKAALDAGVTRKLTKRSVMIVPYSGTFHACMTYITEHYSDMGQKPWEPMGAFVPYVAKQVWDAISETVIAARGAMDWLTKVAAVASKQEDPLPMTWTTPAGLPVRQVRYAMQSVRVKTWLDGKRVDLSYLRETKRLDAARMRSSVAPNFVHSMDAAHCQLTITACVNAYDEGSVTSPMSFAMIHDSFGVHAADMPLFGTLVRQSFHWMYSNHDTIAEFAESNLPVIGDNDMPTPPAKGDLDLDEVLSSQFFFS